MLLLRKKLVIRCHGVTERLLLADNHRRKGVTPYYEGVTEVSQKRHGNDMGTGSNNTLTRQNPNTHKTEQHKKKVLTPSRRQHLIWYAI